MRRAALLLLLLALAAHADRGLDPDTPPEPNDRDDREPVVRRKRTFGDIVFRGLADVLGYNLVRKPTAFPPPLAPVPGVDAPLQAGAPAPAPAPAAVSPCGAPRAVGPPPCRARSPPPPPTPPPCPRPRAVPRPKPPAPRPKPPAPPPCARPRAAPSTPAPCAPAPAPAPAKPKQADSGLETITSNLRLNFDFNRSPATPAPVQSEAVERRDDEVEAAFVPIEPRAARLPAPNAEPVREPRVYVDAFVVRDGVTRRVDAVDARRYNEYEDDDAPAPPDRDDDDVLEDDARPSPAAYDDYEDAQESRDAKKAIEDFGNAVDDFWDKKKTGKSTMLDYLNVHFGERGPYGERRGRDDSETHQSISREKPRSGRVAQDERTGSGERDGREATTSTEDPRRSLVPRVLPPTEHNPNQIDTVTVRVPPVYREKRPRKLNRPYPERPDRDHEEEPDDEDATVADRDERDERPARRRFRRKGSRRTRSAYSGDLERDPYSAADYDYYGRELPISEEELHYRAMTVPPPAIDEDRARVESADDRERFDESERLRDDTERTDDRERADDAGRTDDRERADDGERADDRGRADDGGRSDEQERTDRLGPNARITESGYVNNFARASSVQVDDPNPNPANIKYRPHET